jgi:hypothetical protein
MSRCSIFLVFVGVGVKHHLYEYKIRIIFKSTPTAKFSIYLRVSVLRLMFFAIWYQEVEQSWNIAYGAVLNDYGGGGRDSVFYKTPLLTDTNLESR